MRSRLLAALAAMVLSACAPIDTALFAGDTTGQATAGPAVLDDRELIVLSARPGTVTIDRARSIGYEVIRVDDLSTLDDVLITLRIPEGRSIPEAIAEVEAAAPGVTAGAHHLYTLQSDRAQSFANQMIRWPKNGCRAQVRIGMIDAALPGGHPLLTSGRVAQRNFTATNEAPRTDHGSLMAELLVGPGRITGTTLFSAVAVDPDLGEGETAGVSAILMAIDWLKSQGVRVVNISLAGPRNKLLNRGLGRAAQDGMVLVSAVGNLGPSAPPQFPAAFPFVIGVTAVDAEAAIYGQAVKGPQVDFAAPGVDLLIQTAGGLRVLSGTSAASPFVTGVIAADPRLAGRQVDEVRRTLARGAQDLGAAGRDPVFGAGLVTAPRVCLDAS